MVYQKGDHSTVAKLHDFMIRTTDRLDLSNFHASSVSSSAKQHCL